MSVKISTALRGEHLADPSHSFKAADLDSQFATDVSRHVAMGRRASILLHVSFFCHTENYKAVKLSFEQLEVLSHSIL